MLDELRLYLYYSIDSWDEDGKASNFVNRDKNSEIQFRMFYGGTGHIT